MLLIVSTPYFVFITYPAMISSTIFQFMAPPPSTKPEKCVMVCCVRIPTKSRFLSFCLDSFHSESSIYPLIQPCIYHYARIIGQATNCRLVLYQEEMIHTHSYHSTHLAVRGGKGDTCKQKTAEFTPDTHSNGLNSTIVKAKFLRKELRLPNRDPTITVMAAFN